MMDTERYTIKTTYYRVNELLVVWADMLGYKGVHEGVPHPYMLSVYYRHDKKMNLFPPYNRGGKTVVQVKDNLTGKTVTGEAYCSMSDQFSYNVGRELALERAIQKLTVS